MGQHAHYLCVHDRIQPPLQLQNGCNCKNPQLHNTKLCLVATLKVYEARTGSLHHMGARGYLYTHIHMGPLYTDFRESGH